MPAIITHHLFGEDAARRLPESLSFTDEELLAFLLGNQGSDPFYFCFTATPMAIQACHSFAASMHEGKIVEALLAARDAVHYLPPVDQTIGKAFCLGLLAHYLLDSEAHAFIGQQEDAICNAGVGLEDAHGHVHALIESELDTWMLWSARKQTIDDVPAASNLTRTDHVSRIAGTLLSQIAWQVFGISLGPDRYEGCLRDYELLYRTIDPTGSRRGRMIAGAERLGSRYSLLDALSHSNAPSDNCPSANLACHPWTDPLTGETRTTSFADVFYDTLDMWPALADAYDAGDRTALEHLIKRNYYGGALA